MATAIYLGFVMNVKGSGPKESIDFYGNMFFVFLSYDILVLLALFRMGS